MWRRFLPLLLLLGACVVALAVVLALVLSGSTKKTASGEIQLESAASNGANPFTANVAAPVPTISAASPSFPPVPTPTASPAPVILRPQSGDTVGLYGGTGQLSQCNASQMATYLTQDPSKGTAWVGALNSDPTLRWSGGTSVSTAQIPAYLAQLTPVILRADTRVTNNGFLSGHATPHQSILQAGTAVLVDTYGVPRARCACGNPLLPPRSVSTFTYQGTPWPGYSPTTVVVVNPSPTVINNFTLVNITNNTTYTQPAGSQPSTQPTTPPTPAPSAPGSTQTVTVTARPTQPPSAPATAQPSAPPSVPPSSRLTVPPSLSLGTGDVQVTLLWSGDSDEDLHVIDPAGTEIYFSNPSSPSGGTLDHDEIPGCGSAPSTHVENIFWPPGGAPNGNYQAFVVNFTACPNSPPATYELRITVNGRVVSDTTGTLTQVSGTSSTRVPFTK